MTELEPTTPTSARGWDDWIRAVWEDEEHQALKDAVVAKARVWAHGARDGLADLASRIRMMQAVDALEAWEREHGGG